MMPHSDDVQTFGNQCDPIYLKTRRQYNAQFYSKDMALMDKYENVCTMFKGAVKERAATTGDEKDAAFLEVFNKDMGHISKFEELNTTLKKNETSRTNKDKKQNIKTIIGEIIELDKTDPQAAAQAIELVSIEHPALLKRWLHAVDNPTDIDRLTQILVKIDNRPSFLNQESKKS